MRFVDRIAVVFALGATSVIAPAAAGASAAPASATAVAAFTKVAEWPAGYLGNITVRNAASTTMNGWRVDFDLAADTRIASSFSGVLTRVGNHYTFANAPWNGTLAPGSSVTFGWVADGHGAPTNCTLNGVDCAGLPLDHTAPTRPGPLAFDISAGLTLTWGPSTDDQGAVRYEVYESGRLLATVADPQYVYSTGATLPPRIYVFAVRAVDAGGNPSVLVYRTLGQIWRGDEVPAAPTALRVDVPEVGLVRLAWTGPPDPALITVPPTAGYAVYLDGEQVGQVGASAIVLSAPTAGAHVFGVRTINAVDQYSAAVELAYPVL